MDSKSSSPATKSLDSLSKEELITKCNLYLSIAQKAKAAKDAATKELAKLKQEVQSTNQNNSQSEINNELIEQLTQQKLQLTTEIYDLKSKNSEHEKEKEEINKKLRDNEVLIESLNRQLNRSESDNNALESRLEVLDGENQRLTTLAKEAEAELRRGAVERQDVLEGLGDELVNVKNAAAEALAERDRLKAQLQNQSTSTSNYQVLEQCHLNLQQLKNDQSTLKSDILEFQTTARDMTLELGQALIEAQQATENVARNINKDILAEMNEAMKTRGEVAAKLADKLNTIEREKELLITEKQDLLLQIETEKKKIDEIMSAIGHADENVENKIIFIVEYFNKITNDNTALKETIKENEKRIENCLLGIANKESEITDKASKIQELEADLLQVRTDNKKMINNYINENFSLKIQLDNKDKIIVEKNTEKAAVQEELNKITDKYESSKDDIVRNLEEDKSKLKQNYEELRIAYESLSKQLFKELEKSDSLTSEYSSLKSHIDGTNRENVKLKKANANLREEVSRLNQIKLQFDAFKDELLILNNEKIELSQFLTEKEKEMGEFKDLRTLIHRLTRESDILKMDREKINTQLECLKIENEKLRNEIETVKTDNEKLTNEIKTFKTENEKLTNEIETFKTENEKLTNEIKTENEEESNKDEDVEELKNKNKELNESVNQLKEKLSEYEREREDCEGASVSTFSRTEDTSRLKDLDDCFEEKYLKLRGIAIKLKQKCHDQAAALSKLLNEKSDLQNKLTTILKDKEMLAKNMQGMQNACDALADELEIEKENTNKYKKEINKLDDELKSSQKTHTENMDKMNNLEIKLQDVLKELEKTKQENKKSNVLNLEMAAYERSAAEQDKKLQKLKEELIDVKSELECQKSVTNEHIKITKELEEKCKNLEGEKLKIEELLSESKMQLLESRDLLTSERQKYSESVSRYEGKHSELERIELQLAETTAEKLKIDDINKNFKEQAARQIRILEDKIIELNDTIKSREEEIKIVKDEFESYKIRAQSVLNRQNTNKNKEDPTIEAERESELTLLKTTIEKLQTNLCDINEREKILKSENSMLNNQYTSLQQSARTLANQLSEQNNKYEEIKNKLMKNEELLRETTKQNKLALDTLISSYKQQLSDAEQRHKLEVLNLKEELTLQHQQTTTMIENNENQQSSPPLALLQQREEGEGSENVDLPSLNKNNISLIDHRREPLPLERLLSSSSIADYHDIDTKSEVSFDNASMSSIIAAEKRIKHLSALLSESEADLARLTQQNIVLKEEIRRQQRSMERQQHTISNSEYLKNVVMKFITLQGGDERSRLVPVLNTILKLSPEETEQLQIVANGIATTSGANQASSSSAGGWSSYLHLWSGTH